MHGAHMNLVEKSALAGRREATAGAGESIVNCHHCRNARANGSRNEFFCVIFGDVHMGDADRLCTAFRENAFRADELLRA